MFMRRCVSFSLTTIVLALLSGCSSKPHNDLQTDAANAWEVLQNKDVDALASENREWVADLFIQAKEFLRTENHEALFQSKIVREDNSSSTPNQLSLAYHFRTGQSFGTYSVAKNVDKALYRYTRAADTGNSVAHFNIACLTYKSRQAIQDIPEPFRSAKAAKSMQIAAEQGLLFAQLDLSSYYRYGIGVEVNFEWSDYWLSEAEKTLGKGYLPGIRPPKPSDPLALQSTPASGRWEHLYLNPDDVEDWLLLSGVANFGEPASRTQQNTVIAAYLKSGYCSPIDSREAKFLRLR